MRQAFRIVPGFPETERPVAVRLFWRAFSGKLGTVMGPEEKALRFLDRVIDPGFALGALSPDGRLLGLAGFKTDQGALVAGGLEDMIAVYGTLGGTCRGLLLDVLERETEPHCLLMDGIFVAEEARGQGVGSALLEAVCAQARERGLARVRLDVINTNPRARALYERAGFKAVSEEKTGVLEVLFGFSSATRMERTV
ncbi:GNAT family N-acetyltransferase [Roseibium sediminicola]|uniref:GNAT family N-acetyltransferase n=1 Tax=Roseibium sediminicola TaxID=2933272 RepID=A0ABT0H0R7_9HYPH|nr:GNAT family N-acetyltransferase [Roseibium sp. CAU 1639]MCK7615287.1 GNAT family N-acetyltransferase [Roseibium sp. CAU 1639]